MVMVISFEYTEDVNQKFAAVSEMLSTLFRDEKDVKASVHINTIATSIIALPEVWEKHSG